MITDMSTDFHAKSSDMGWDSLCTATLNILCLIELKVLLNSSQSVRHSVSQSVSPANKTKLESPNLVSQITSEI